MPMEDMDPVQESIKLSIEKIIDLIRQLRNDLIKDFLTDPNLKSYFFQQYGKDLSIIKIEFCKRDLKELLISPVDLTHYSSLIKDIRESNKASLAEGNHELFYKDLEMIFKKYTY